jgi:hypothetical protein
MRKKNSKLAGMGLKAHALGLFLLEALCFGAYANVAGLFVALYLDANFFLCS